MVVWRKEKTRKCKTTENREACQTNLAYSEGCHHSTTSKPLSYLHSNITLFNYYHTTLLLHISEITQHNNIITSVSSNLFSPFQQSAINLLTTVYKNKSKLCSTKQCSPAFKLGRSCVHILTPR